MVNRPAAAVFLLLLATAPALAKLPLNPPQPSEDPPSAGQVAHPNPGHLSKPHNTEPLEGYGPFQRLPSIDESKDTVAEVRKKPYWQAGTFDPLLSAACRIGDFVTTPTNRVVVRFTDPQGPAALQVVTPNYRHLLYDRTNLAKPTETYYFKDTNRPTCQVWIGGKLQPRKLDPVTHSSLHPGDRKKALAERKKAMKDWPQK